MIRHGLFVIVCILEIIVLVDAVDCSESYISAERHQFIDPIHCTDPFNDPLVIYPSLPNGLSFENGTIYGIPIQCSELTEYTITSTAGKTDPFILQIGILCEPSLLEIDEADLYIVRNVALNGIMIHSNTVFTEINSNELPEGLVIDSKRRMIIGTYIGDYSGYYTIHLIISNKLGSYAASFKMILSTSLKSGMTYTIYDAPCDLNFTSHLPDFLTKVKEGISFETDIPSTELTSFLYTPSTSCQFLVFSTVLKISQSGYYSFRLSDDSLITHKHSFYRVYVDSFLVYDSLSSYPYSLTDSLDRLQALYFQSNTFPRVRIEYYSTSPNYRNLHLEWLMPSSHTFSTIPSTCLFYPSKSILTYASTQSTVYKSQPFDIAPLIDWTVFNASQQACSVAFWLENTDIQEVKVDSSSGKVHGVLSREGKFELHILYHISCAGISVDSKATMSLTSISVDALPPLEYRMNDMIVTEICLMVNDPLLLTPTNTTETIHLFSIEPALPTGLSFDSFSGVISGQAYSELESTLFTITLSTPFGYVSTVLSVTITARRDTHLFHGWIRGNLTSLNYQLGKNMTNEWSNAPVDMNGHYSFFVTASDFVVALPVQPVNGSVVTEFSLMRGDGLLFVDRNSWYTGSILPVESYPLFVKFLTEPDNPPTLVLQDQPNMQGNTYSFTYHKGVSINAIFMVVVGVHYPLTLSPAFSHLHIEPIHFADVMISPTPQENYRITGYFEETGVFVYKITAENGAGQNTIVLEFMIENADDFDYITFSDTIDLTNEYYYDFFVDSTLVLHNIPSERHNTITIPRENKKILTLRICRYQGQSFKQTDIHVIATLNRANQIFSANFFGSSVTDLFPCRSYDINYQFMITLDSEWRYLSSYETPYKWTALDFDDDAWRTSTGVFYSNPINILYLRNVITINQSIQYSSFVLNLLVKEGLVMYVNGMEVMRVNMESVGNVKAANATHSFTSYHFIPSSLSHQYFHQGTNVIAVAVHSHTLSTMSYLFSLELLLLASNEFVYTPAYPTIDSSSDSSAAYHIANVVSSSHTVWRGQAGDRIFYTYPFSSHQYINTIAITRTDTNMPQSIELYGVWYYQDAYGIKREATFLLLQQSDLNWSGKSQLVFSLPSAKTSYHAYRFVVNPLHPSSSVEISRLLFYADNQGYCDSGHDSIAVGDSTCIPCEGTQKGVQVIKCVRTNHGVELRKEQDFCSDMSVHFGQTKIRFSIIANGFLFKSIDTITQQIQTSLTTLLEIPSSSLHLYYSNYRLNAEPFCYMEMYLEIGTNLWKGRRCLHALTDQRQMLSQQLVKMIPDEISIEIDPLLYSRRDCSLLLALFFVIALLCFILLFIFTMHVKKVIKERRENYLLMC